ncbi:MAG: hypothetical protein FWE77_05345 [Clostridia bacterium]|nr:hypothetical protein [Clostridia bacterium]
MEWIVLLILVAVAGSLLMQGGGGAAQIEGGQTDLEKRLAHVLSAIDGAGRVEVIIHTVQSAASQPAASFGAASLPKEEKPSGVIVVAEGAGDLQVRLDIARAVQTLLGLPASAVEVLPGGGSP